MISLLCDLTKSKREEYGSKATTLGELSKIGVQIPNGFALSVDAYSDFLDFIHFPYGVDDYLAQNKDIINFILHGNFPDKTINILQHYFESLNVGMDKKSFVVRSSAICEDSESYSMAGVFSSYIDLSSFKQLIESIKKCYASLFSDKALSMMIRYGIPLNDLKMGIIVQEFISGSLSGVAFTADTVKMDSDILIINSVNSICADYVDGKYPSSQYRVNKATCDIMSSFVPPSTPQLSKNEIAKLHNGVLHVENALGYYQDVEWTIKDSNLYILQARPITTFRYRKYPDNWFEYSKNDTLMLSEDKALTPLHKDIKTIWHNATCKGWEYSSKGRNGRFEICNGYFFDAVDERDWDKRAKFREWLEELLFDGKNIFQDIQLPQLLPLREELKSLLQRDISIFELENALIKSKHLFELSVEINMSAVDGSIIPLETFEKYCKRFDNSLSKDDFYDLVYGISKLSEERQSVIELSLFVKVNTDLIKLFDTYCYDEILYYHLKNNEAGKELLQGIDKYLEEYGLIAVNGQWQFDSPVIREQPWYVLGKIRACIDIDSDLFFYSRNKSLKNKELVIEKLTASMSESVKAEFMKRLEGAEKAFLVNDDHCFYLDLCSIGYFRLAIIKTANLLEKMGVISKTEDINFLMFDEIISFLKMIQSGDTNIRIQDEINKRKSEYNLQKRIIPPTYIGVPPVLTSPKEIQISNEDSNVIRGVSGLNKKVIGKVKVITDNINIHLGEDVILVLKHGHACYFLPFISKIKGLIYDGGSPYDHLGIIARELLIPSLYNTQNATSVLKDGDEVELDGINECVIIKSR